MRREILYFFFCVKTRGGRTWWGIILNMEARFSKSGRFCRCFLLFFTWWGWLRWWWWEWDGTGWDHCGMLLWADSFPYVCENQIIGIETQLWTLVEFLKFGLRSLLHLTYHVTWELSDLAVTLGELSARRCFPPVYYTPPQPTLICQLFHWRILTVWVFFLYTLTIFCTQTHTKILIVYILSGFRVRRWNKRLKSVDKISVRG